MVLCLSNTALPFLCSSIKADLCQAEKRLQTALQLKDLAALSGAIAEAQRVGVAKEFLSQALQAQVSLMEASNLSQSASSHVAQTAGPSQMSSGQDNADVGERAQVETFWGACRFPSGVLFFAAL